jgi:dihydroorotate dehydrogenase
MKPWLYLPPKISHDLSPLVLKGLTFLKPWPDNTPASKKLLGLEFLSPFGTAGGLDKGAHSLNSWAKMGAGFLEVGTLTPKPQGPNPGSILQRSLSDKALWNAMGFPNAGFDAVKPKIKSYKELANKKKLPPLFINIGKNRTTSLKDSHKDYLKGIEFFADLADAFVVNISSPNTKDLRLLHKEENFIPFIEPLLEASKLTKKPMLLKLSPDLEEGDFKSFIKLCANLPLDGITLTNTTSSRPKSLKKSFPDHGGLSGQPLKELSLEKLKWARSILDSEGSNQTLVSVGGVMNPEDAYERLKFGADLVQMYSGLIFHGPTLLKDSADFFLKRTDLQ